MQMTQLTDVEILGALRAYVKSSLLGQGAIQGDDGFSPTIVVKTNTDSEYVLTITDKNGSYDTPNLKASGDVYGAFIGLDIMHDLGKYSAGESVNVKDCGAIGDGKTNDGDAFLAAISQAVSENKKYILIPHGKYELGHIELILPANIQLIGENANNTVLKNCNFTAPYGISAKYLGFDGGTNRDITEQGYYDYNYNLIIYATPKSLGANIEYDGCIFMHADYADWASYRREVDNINYFGFNHVRVTNCIFENLNRGALMHETQIDYAEYASNTFRNIGHVTTDLTEIYREIANPSGNPKSQGWYQLISGEYVLSNDTSVVDEHKPYYRYIMPRTVGIKCGDTSNITQNKLVFGVIRDNLFDTFIADSYADPSVHVDEANFITVHAEKVTITRNKCLQLIGYAHDREGIYTKALHCDISYNYLINAGLGEGYICCKNILGDDYNRAIFVHDNVIVGQYGRGMMLYGNCIAENNTIILTEAKGAIRAGDASLDNEVADLPDYNNAQLYPQGPARYVGTLRLLTEDMKDGDTVLYEKGFVYEWEKNGTTPETYSWKQKYSSYQIGSIVIRNNYIYCGVKQFYLDGAIVDDYFKVSGSYACHVVSCTRHMKADISGNTIVFDNQITEGYEPDYWFIVRTQGIRSVCKINENQIVSNIDKPNRAVAVQGARMALVKGVYIEINENDIKCSNLPIIINLESLECDKKTVVVKNNIVRDPKNVRYGTNSGYGLWIKLSNDDSDGDLLVYDTTQLEGFKSNFVYASKLKNIEIPDISWVTRASS